MKEIKSGYIAIAAVIIVAIVGFLIVRNSKPVHTPYCPVCGSELENEHKADPGYALEWLLETGDLDKYLDEQGYILKEDIPAFLRSYPEIIEEDAMWEDNVQAYLRSHGWTIVEPKQ